MTSASLDSHYTALDARYPLEETADYGALVVPADNGSVAWHRWFHQKESFSRLLVQRVIEDAGLRLRKQFRLLDPFAGVGTSLLSSLEYARDAGLRVSATGIEVNPFLAFVAETKLAAAVTTERCRPLSFAERVVERFSRTGVSVVDRPALSTFADERYFDEATLEDLLRLKEAISAESGSPLEKALGRLCLASIVEPVSYLRRDGRALRYEPNKRRADTLDSWIERCGHVAVDIARERMNDHAAAHVYCADGRRPPAPVRQGPRPDVVLFSPPYPNNIDYTEVYKLEAWLLGYYSDVEHFRAQRLRTLRSHPSVKFPDGGELTALPTTAAGLIDPILSAIPEGRYWAQRQRTVQGYFIDMYSVFQQYRKLCKSTSRVIYVVGNSVHGSGDDAFVIAADTVLARLAELSGFSVERIAIARRTGRGGKSDARLRESVVFLRPTIRA